MALDVDNLFDLDQPTVASRCDQLAQLLQEMHPTIYVKRGVIFDYVLNPAAMYSTLHTTLWQQVQQAMSLLALSQNPEIADPDLEDAVASNYRVARLTGEQASGQITMILSEDLPMTVSSGATFTANGQTFQTLTSFTARDVAALVQLPTDRLLVPLSDGTYAFVIDVQCTTEGLAGMLKQNAVVTPANPPANFIKAFATSDFLGGYSAESNTSLINRLLPGIAASALSGPVNMEATLIQQTAFSRVVADSVVGMGAPEMKRDKHSIFPGTTGGKIDWYIRTQALPQSIVLAKTATYVGPDTDGVGLWQFSVGRDDAPGFYDFPLICLPTSGAILGTYQIVSDQRSVDLSPLDNDGFLPDIVNDLEGRYSRFQTATVRFRDTDTPTSGLTVLQSTQAYNVTARALPLIAAIQDAVVAQKTRNPMGDCLVRAAVPCFVRLSLVIRLAPGQLSPDVPTIQNALAALVNQTGFTGALPASQLSQTVQDQLNGASYVDAIDMVGKLQHQDLSWRLLRSTETLLVPEETVRGTSPRTVVFFLDPADVAISILPT
jgi:hypothetical protein